MSAKDISRFLLQPQKRYSGVRMQQGRVILDSDWNESERIDDEEARRTMLEVLCSGGTPNQGFLVSKMIGGGYNFTWRSGSFYLGGLRFEAEENESFLSQADWLQIDMDPKVLPGKPNKKAGERYDLVYLRGWEQCVTAVEDSELRERALGGPDTSVRIRRMRRVEVLEKVSGNCTEAFDELKLKLAGEAVGKFDDTSHELRPKIRLTVTPGDSDFTEDPCKPNVEAGFLGAENQTIRVQLTAANRFIWGYDNASPFYRVQVKRHEGALAKVTFLTLPRDAAAQPLKGQAVEIIPWGALLANKEKVAELRGHLATVEASFNADDPEGPSIIIADPVPEQWITWLDGHSQYLSDRDPEDRQKYFYLRLWTGGSGDSVHPDHDFAKGKPVPLQGTGLNVTFSHTGPAGVHWIIAARPNTPDEVVPWELMEGAPPAGPRFFFSPLAVIHWPDTSAGGGGSAKPVIHDCRHRFRPLCEVGGCCTVTVGDGKESFGDFASIQDAVNHLTADGGEICVLAGTYRENITIDKDHVRIHGCGTRTRVLSGKFPENKDPEPVFEVTGGRRNVRIESLYVEAHERGVGVLIRSEQGSEPHNIALLELDIQAAQGSAMKILGAQQIVIRDCDIAMLDLPSEWHAIHLRADGALLEHNTIRVESSPPLGIVAGKPVITAGRGGVQIAGGSERVQIIDNFIAGGIGNGITLGSVEEIQGGQIVDRELGWVVGKDDPCDPCAPGGIYILWPGENGTGPEYHSAGALYEIRIERNRIFNMGLSGIGVVGFFDLSQADEFITVDGLDILGNEIRGCLQRELEPIPENMRVLMGYGAVTLADVESLRLHDNIIEDNGPDHNYPVCGVFVLHGEGVDIDRNRILNTGAKSDVAIDAVEQGPRGGIVIVYAVPGIVPLQFKLLQDKALPRQSGEPAVRIHDNIVSQPLGQALFIGALGPVSVHGNQLTSRGMIMRSDDISLWATAVFILNLGVSSEFYWQLLGFTGATADLNQPGALPAKDGEFIFTSGPGIDDVGLGRYLANGNVLFNDNQVLTDLIEPNFALAISSVMIISLDDISVQNNQFDCDFFIDVLLTNLFAMGLTVRVNNNRFKESLYGALFSSVELGLIYNNTSDNQATHCLLHLDSPFDSLHLATEIVQHHNQVLGDALTEDTWCKQLKATLGLKSTGDGL